MLKEAENAMICITLLVGLLCFTSPCGNFILNTDMVVSAVSVQHGSGRFGDTGRPKLKADELQGFPQPRNFFENYAFMSKPLVFRGAVKSMPAYQLWQSDSYFLSLEIGQDDLVTVETMKKENRTQEVIDLDFKEFVRTYKHKEIYMVQRMPQYLG